MTAVDVVDRILRKYAGCPGGVCQAGVAKAAPAPAPIPPVKQLPPIGAAQQGVVAAELPKIAAVDNREASFKPKLLSRTYSNDSKPRQVDPALQIGPPGKGGMTAKINDPRVEQAYRELLKKNNIVSPRNELAYQNLLWRARTEVYGPQVDRA